MLEIILFILTCFYFLVIFTLFYGLTLIEKGGKRVDRSYQPFISIVIAARNEEENISDCLNSVLKQTYPHYLFEVILVNDRSTDRTEEIAKEFLNANSQLKIISTQEDSKLRGKVNALAQGIDIAKGEIILMTDADCTVQPTWIEEVVSRYTPEVGILGSITIQKATDWFSGMQSLDWVFIQGLGGAAIALKNPLSVIGNNLSFRKKAYDEVGGYRNIKFSVTEDFALFKAIVGTKHWEPRFPIDEKILVTSEPCPDWKILVQQKHRWGKGGLDIKLSGLLIMAAGFAMHLGMICTSIWGNFGAVGIAFILKSTSDYFFLHRMLKTLNRLEQLKYFYWFEFYFIFYVMALPFIVLFNPRVKWKGRTF